jgi:hypothetical protein
MIIDNILPFFTMLEIFHLSLTCWYHNALVNTGGLKPYHDGAVTMLARRG